MTTTPAQRKTRTKATLDTSVVAGLAFFGEQNRTKKHQAAILVAEDALTDEEIAKAVKIGRTTLWEWKQHPEFQQVIGDYRGRIIAEALRLPIAKKHERVRQLNELNERYWAIIEDRAAMYAEMAGTPEEAARAVFGNDTVPWARTGMMVQQPKIAASGKTVVEWAFDRSLDSAIKETHKQAAQELGQWEDRASVDVNQVIREYVGINPEDV